VSPANVSSTIPRITVIVCAHNPHAGRLARTIEGLRQQDLPLEKWEFLLVDNASTTPLETSCDLSWHPLARVVREETLGLTPARAAGIREARSPLLVFVDDDNVLCPEYLSHSLAVMDELPRLGALGGRSIPQYEIPPPPWIGRVEGLLACRDLGGERLLYSWEGLPPEARSYPAMAPIGAGMVVRRDLALLYISEVENSPRRQNLDRRGKSLASGGDNDMILSILGRGWAVGYEPVLTLQHLIPSTRMDPVYLQRLSQEMMRSWVDVLDVHGIRPWKPVPRWTVPLLKVKYILTHRPWRSLPDRIAWRSACGQAEGRGALAR
jgi:glycosyltransferase involved in cell wall biosynthesis